MPGTWPDSQQEIDRLGTAGGDFPGRKPVDLVIEDKVSGTGLPVEKASIARFLYMVVKMDGTIIDDNGRGGVPVCLAST